VPQAFADLEEIVVANIQRVETDQLLIMELQKNYHYIGRRMQRLGTLPSNGRRAIKRKHEVVEDTPVAVAVPVEGGGGDGGGGGEEADADADADAAAQEYLRFLAPAGALEAVRIAPPPLEEEDLYAPHPNQPFCGVES